MASLIPGYEYDIFISYRQKDNKHDGWVTEFVNQLKGELESTFKEDISIYFDKNPNDGLLETHNVGKSLEGKLKCLIFIPVISQTYCDSKSFAWQHEFCAFNKSAKEDMFGRDIRLAGGNIASRILPVKIHDLDQVDKALLENELGGVLRCIEFIYKSAGVNRPLRANEDHPHDNLHKTYFRDQINKVANAIKEIINALKKQNQHSEEVPTQDSEVKPVVQKNLKTKIISGFLILLTLIAVGYLFITKMVKSEEQLEKSIAVLPFINDSPDQENTYFINGIMEEVLNNLQKIKEFRVLSRTSADQYRDSNRPTIPEIAEKLDVNYIVEGSGQKYGNKFVLRVQFIAANNERHLWAKSYDREILQTTDIINIQSEIAQAIATELKAILTPEEKQQIEKIPTANLNAYNKYLIANEYRKEYVKTRDLNTYQKAVAFYKTALAIDSTFAKAYTGLANAYYSRFYWETYYEQNFLDSCLVLVNKALAFDDQLDEAYYIKGYYYNANGYIEEALDNFNKAININPNFSSAYTAKGNILSFVKFDYVKCFDNYFRALSLINGEERPALLRSLGVAFLAVGFVDKARYYYQQAFALDSNNKLYLRNLAWLEFSNENFEEAFSIGKKINEIDSIPYSELLVFNTLPKHTEEAYIYAMKLAEYFKSREEPNIRQSFRVGYACWKMGKYKEAEDYFNKQIKYSEESINLARRDAQIMQAQINLLCTYAFLGDKIKAYKYLDELNRAKFYFMGRMTLFKHDPMLANIRNEERFQKILLNMEAEFQAEHERVRKWLEEQGML